MMDTASINVRDLADCRRVCVSRCACQMMGQFKSQEFWKGSRELHRTESQDRSYLDPSVDFAEA